MKATARLGQAIRFIIPYKVSGNSAEPAQTFVFRLQMALHKFIHILDTQQPPCHRQI